jgi:cytochrome bd ubiquinol oxidase subunit I
MNYPFWDVPHIGSGWVIGLIAIFHVMISHFAVGGGLYLPLTEHKALREGRKDWLEILRKHAKFFLVLTGVFGAVSGVGIWFAIGLTHPEGTSALIHNFVFGWAMEWVFFMLELTTAAVYYYTWGRIPNQLHLKIGYFYAFTSFFTLFIINGILTFMLFPGKPWLEVAGTGQEASRFWQAFFNPTFWPSLGLRCMACVSLAGVWALLSCSRINGDDQPQLKTSMVRWSAKWLLPSFLTLPLFFGWYLWEVPESQRALLQLGISTISSGVFSQLTRASFIVMSSSIVVVAVVYLFAWRSPRDLAIPHAIGVLFLALCATGSTEYAREMLRKPYVIGGYMYSNGVRKTAVAKNNENGYLATTPWIAKTTPELENMARGEAMFRGQCMSCHTRDSYRSMTRLLAGRNRETIGNLLKILHEYALESPYRKFMPPLVGTPAEIDSLADYLTVISQAPEPEAKPKLAAAPKEAKPN